jgi:hypothetical protein
MNLRAFEAIDIQKSAGPIGPSPYGRGLSKIILFIMFPHKRRTYKNERQMSASAITS